jgi:hypothetical protein
VPIVDAALAYLDAGHPLFPCLPNKQPATPHGFKDATLDADRISRWWARHPDHLLATPTAGWLVVDCDVGHGHHGYANWCDLARPYGWAWTDTRVAITPSGGLHIWWRAATALGLRNTAGRLAPGIDTRADGGYVILAPSIVDDDHAYLWDDVAPEVIADIPAWLAQLLREPARSTPVPSPARRSGDRYWDAAVDGELGRLASTPNGRRNDQLNHSAYTLARLAATRAGADLPGAAHRLLEVAVNIGLTDTEALATIESGISAGVQRPRPPQP